MFHHPMTIAITLLACGILSAAEPQSPAKEATNKVAKSPLEPSMVTGFYARLSPEGGGGHFVSSNCPGEIVCVSKEPALTASDIEQVRVRPKADQFVIEIKLSKAARENFKSDHIRLPGIVQGLVIVRDGKVEPIFFSVEDLVSKRVLLVGTYPSLADAKVFFDLFERTRVAK